MNPYEYQQAAAAFASNQFDRELAMSMLLNASAAGPADALTMAHFGGLPSYGSASRGLSAPPAHTTQDMLRLQRELLNREFATRSAALAVGETPLFYRSVSGGQQQHPPLSSLLSHPASAAAMAAAARAVGSPGSSPSLKPTDAPGGHGASLADASSSKRAVSDSSSSSHDSPLQGLPAAMAAARRDSLLGLTTLAVAEHAAAAAGSAANKRPRLGGSFAYPSSPNSSSGGQGPVVVGGGAQHPAQQQQQRRGSKAKLRDDFWGKVGKNNSHIHLVNIVLGRLLHDQVRKAQFGNKVLSNDLIQQILDNKLYGKYAVRDFFASSNKGSETVRNTWTRLNFSSDNIRQGLSRYKEQTWQAIERCGFDDPSDDDKAEMDEALKIFVKTHRFVNALNVALKGIITEEFMGVLMQLRLEWNSLCLNCRPEDHDTVVTVFLRKYGLNGK